MDDLVLQLRTGCTGHEQNEHNPHHHAVVRGHVPRLVEGLGSRPMAARVRGRRARRRRGRRAREPAGSCSAGRARPLAPRLASARAERRVGEDERASAGREEVLEWMGYARAARERPPRMKGVHVLLRRSRRCRARSADPGAFSHAPVRVSRRAPRAAARNHARRTTMRALLGRRLHLPGVAVCRRDDGAPRAIRISVLEGSPTR